MCVYVWPWLALAHQLRMSLNWEAISLGVLFRIVTWKLSVNIFSVSMLLSFLRIPLNWALFPGIFLTLSSFLEYTFVRIKVREQTHFLLTLLGKTHYRKQILSYLWSRSLLANKFSVWHKQMRNITTAAVASPVSQGSNEMHPSVLFIWSGGNINPSSYQGYFEQN